MDGLDIIRNEIAKASQAAPKPITAATINLMIQASLASFVAHELPLAVEAVISGTKPAGTGVATATTVVVPVK